MTQTATLTESLTYAQLVAKIQASELKKGASYTITDFQTVHYIIDDDDVWLDGFGNPEINTGVVEPITVTALSNNILNREAKSTIYPLDLLYYDWNPNNWLFDIAFAAWDEVIISGWKGVIYHREHTLNNISVPGDWRNVKCRRWALSSAPSDFSTVYAGIGSTAAGVSDPNDYQDFLMFEETEIDPLDKRVLGLTISPFRDSHDMWYTIPTILPNNVFHVSPNYGWWQIIDVSFGASCRNNTFGENVEVCSIGSDFLYNLIGSNFHYNTIGVSFKQNTTGRGFKNNTIGNNFVQNVTKGRFESNNIGNDFVQNVIEDSFFYNNIGNVFTFCEIGSFFRNNTVGNFVSYLKTPNKTLETVCTMNLIHDGVQGTSGAKLDFTSATHVFLGYNCEIFKRLDGTIRLKYVDNTDADVVVAYNA